MPPRHSNRLAIITLAGIAIDSNCLHLRLRYSYSAEYPDSIQISVNYNRGFRVHYRATRYGLALNGALGLRAFACALVVARAASINA